MTRIALRTPQPKKYTAPEIHALVCQHKAKWQKLPEIALHLHHSSDTSAVTGLAWCYHCGSDLRGGDLKALAQRYHVSIETLHALGRILGVQPIPPAT